MPPQETSSLKLPLDELAKKNADQEYEAWVNNIRENMQHIVEWASACIDWEPTGSFREWETSGVLHGTFEGTYNFAIRIKDESPPFYPPPIDDEVYTDVVIVFPMPGRTATHLRDEKVLNQVYAMEYLRENTSLPVPKVRGYGTRLETPHDNYERYLLQFGPFIVMDYIEGTPLSNILTSANQPVDTHLNSNIEKIYRQIATYHLQISRLTLPHIGSISKSSNQDPHFTLKRPLTPTINTLSSLHSYPASQLPTGPFTSTTSYLASIAHLYKTNLLTQRNIAPTPEILRKRFLARRGFEALIPKYVGKDTDVDTDTGPFKPFLSQLTPSNILLDPSTLEIKGVLGAGWMNAIPAQFAYDPPAWLLGKEPEEWVVRGAVREFEEMYGEMLEGFLRVLREVEDEDGGGAGADGRKKRLSERMREGWETGRFWFDYAVRKGEVVDCVYWDVLREGQGDGELDEEASKEMEEFVKKKMEQLNEYEVDCSKRFSRSSDCSIRNRVDTT